ncbi:MAG TPA: glycosyltransferase family 2 protein [Anaerolineales bacterium]|nr:glycosyltransferase family 2 protein [Anaerolineales bacterium]
MMVPNYPLGTGNAGLVYILIINWNQAALTIECLESVYNTEGVHSRVLVVDNGSTDDSVQQICHAFPEVEVLEAGENLGYSEGNNFGLRYALQQGADYILLLNNDTAIDPQMLPGLLSVAESDPHIGIVGPTQLYFDLPDTIWGADNHVEWSQGLTRRARMGEILSDGSNSGRIPESVEADYIDTCAALVRAEVFRQIGLLDPRYFINFDDADLGLRTKKAGFQVICWPAARMWHKVSAAMGQASPATTYYMTRNLLLLFSSHAHGTERLQALLRILARTLRTVGTWTLKPAYRGDALFQRRRDANLYAMRDFFIGRFGKMGSDVARACFGK